MLEKVGIVVLAAGSSSRLGESKQLLQYKGKSLLKRCVENAISSKASAVVVVLGACYNEHTEELKGKPVVVTKNPSWEIGIGTSISWGIQELTTYAPQTTAAIIMVCDQPFIEVETIDALIDRAAGTAKGIIASKYANTIGTPVLFKRVYFPDLKNLKENKGAKALFEQYGQDVESLQFIKGEIDIDTKDDYIRLLKHTTTIENY